MKEVKLSDNAQTVAKKRYYMNGENWEECTHRVASINSVAEVNDKIKYRDQFHEMIYNMDFIPAGRILRNSGRPKGSMLNCYVLSIGDSIEEIGQFYKDALILWSEGGGVGCNFSPLRPKGDVILGKGGESSGLVSFLKAANHLAQTIESGGSRRAAALACVDISHPEVLDFIDAKIQRDELNYFNISVGVNNEFLEAVESNKDWSFAFKHKSYRTIKARDLWIKIIENMIECAEPGFLNMSNLIKNNSYYFDPVVATNPCGEIPLENYGVCCLGSLVLPNFITGNVNTNWKKLEHVIKLAVRFLDNVLDINKYILKENDVKAHNSRRIGLGILGIAEYLFAKKLRYGSRKATDEIEKLVRFIRDISYQSSIELAIEKGSFPKFDPVLYGKASFIKKLPAQIRMDIKKFGIRNTTINAIAPTGTTSLLTTYTPAIEPLFAKAYKRNDRVGERIYIHPMYEEFLKRKEEIPDWYVDAFDLKPKDHFEIQVAAQKYIDSSVSKTINLPKNTTVDQLSSLLFEYLYELKGVTVYRDGCRPEQILNKINEEETIKYLKDKNKTIDHELTDEDVQCATGSCEI